MERETIVKFETSIDHLSAEEIGAALIALNDMGEVLDACYFSGIGKKNRPCGKLEVLCHRENKEMVAQAIFRHTHTLGLRFMEMERLILPRSIGEVELASCKIRAKTYMLEGLCYSRPEADELIGLAKANKLGMPAFRILRKK